MSKGKSFTLDPWAQAGVGSIPITRSIDLMRFFLILLVLLVPLSGSAQQASWYLLSREEGCLDLRTLVETQKLPHAPTSPEDYAQMMRERGKEVSLELPKDVPADLRGKIVQVRIGNEEGGPVFVRDEVCRTLRK